MTHAFMWTHYNIIMVIDCRGEISNISEHTKETCLV